MTSADPHGPTPVGVSALLAEVIGVVCFGAFAILGLGMLSFFADIDIIAVEGLQLWPGVIGMLVAVAVFAAMLWPVLAHRHPSFAATVLVAIVAVIAHLGGVWLSAMITGVGLAHASAAVAQLVMNGSSLVLLAVALIAGWIAVALRRTRSGPPKWPWERTETR